MSLKYKHKRAYMECCEAFAKCSDDERLQVGSVIVSICLLIDWVWWLK